MSRITAFEKKISALGLLTHVDGVNHNVDDDSGDEGDEEYIDDENDEEVQNMPEKAILLLPSNLTPDQQALPGLDDLGKQEAKLRIGQMNDALEQLKLALGGKSLIMRKKVSVSYY